MDRKDPINDNTISRNVTRQLSSSGLRSPCHIQVQTRNGEVTLSGTVQFVHQKNTAVQAIRTVEGVKRIVEKIKVTPPAKHQYPEPTARTRSEAVAEHPDAASMAVVAEAQANVPNVPESVPAPLETTAPTAVQLRDESADMSFTVGHISAADRKVPSAGNSGLHHTRSGDSYTFDCDSEVEAEKLRVLLATFADWFKKNSWVGQSKVSDNRHRVTFHAKSLIDFLRQAGF